MPIILTIQEAEKGRSWLEASLRKWFTRPYLEKNPSQKRAGGVVQDVGPEFKHQY
jgi:hypothetical protein